MLTLTTICDTYFKVLPRQTASLADGEKLFIQADEVFAIQNYAEEGEHFRIILEKPIKDRVIWFVLITTVRTILNRQRWNAGFSIITEANTNGGMRVSASASKNVRSIVIKDTKVDDSLKVEPSRLSLKQLLWARLGLENSYEYFQFLTDRLGGKSIELEVEASGKKLKVKASNRQELEAAIKAAQDSVGEGKLLGKILFDIPEQMKVGIPERVSLRITKELTYDFFEDLIHQWFGQFLTRKLSIG